MRTFYLKFIPIHFSNCFHFLLAQNFNLILRNDCSASFHCNIAIINTTDTKSGEALDNFIMCSNDFRYMDIDSGSNRKILFWTKNLTSFQRKLITVFSCERSTAWNPSIMVWLHGGVPGRASSSAYRPTLELFQPWHLYSYNVTMNKYHTIGADVRHYTNRMVRSGEYRHCIRKSYYVIIGMGATYSAVTLIVYFRYGTYGYNWLICNQIIKYLCMLPCAFDSVGKNFDKFIGFFLSVHILKYVLVLSYGMIVAFIIEGPVWWPAVGINW